jgi:ribonuclease Z
LADWRLTFVGSGSLLSAPYRGFPATLLEASGLNLLFDCGDGTVGRLRTLGNPSIDAVAVTSTSVSELAGLLTFAEVHRRSRRKPLRVFGPPGLKRALANLSTLSAMGTAELFDFQESTAGHVLLEQGGKHLEAVEVDLGEGLAGFAYLVYESPLPGRVDAATAEALGIKGSDFARLQAGQTVRGVRPGDVIGPRRPGRRVVVAGRGRATDALEANLKGSDAAVFAAPFMDERLEMAEDTHYLTGWEAAELASRSRVQVVLLQQLGPYAPVRHQLEEARQFHGRLFAPDDGDVLRIPLPGTGVPALDRGQRARPETSQQRGTPARVGKSRSPAARSPGQRTR